MPSSVSSPDIPYSDPSLISPVNKLVCVIDDDASCHQAIGQSLAMQDCDVIFAKNVDEFMSMSPLPDPDVLLLGVDVFDPDAVDNVSRVSQNSGSSKTPMILSMAYFMPGSFDHMLKQAGCNICLRKSGDLEEVIAAVKDVTECSDGCVLRNGEMEASA